MRGDFLIRDGNPLFPVGTNYFSTEENGWDFSGPRNAWVWEKDFDEMSRHGLTFINGPFDGDAHLHSTGRQNEIGISYQTEPLTIRDHAIHFPSGEEIVSFSGNKTTVLDRAILPGGEDWIEKPLGKGKILFSALPLELNDNLQALGDIYRYALKTAGVSPVYTTTLNDPGIVIAPSAYPEATLYVITSESNRHQVSFEDVRSQRKFSGTLESGRAALLLIGTDGKLLATYNWPGKR